MCIGIPMRVIEQGFPLAWCTGRGEQKHVDMLITGSQPPGTWVLEFHGVARRVLAEDEAKETNSALDALEAVMRGESDVDAYFADLAGREPELPVHLRGGKS